MMDPCGHGKVSASLSAESCPATMGRREFAALVMAAASSLCAAEVPAPAGRKIVLRIGEGFDARPVDIQAVLLSAAGAIWAHCPHTRWEAPGFFIFHSEAAPISLFDHGPDGCIGIGLTSQGRHWAQYAFQFAHEFCHALASHANDFRQPWRRGRKPNHWLEESLCETASLFTLRAMATGWRTAPPYPNWKPFAEALASYAVDRLSSATADLAKGRAFADWFRENEPLMREKATLREKNNVVAAQLLPLFEAHPAGWEAVTFYNLGKRDAEETLATRIGEWRQAAPEELREFVGKVGAIFGV